MRVSIFKKRVSASEGRRRFYLSLRLWAAIALLLSQDPTRAAQYFVTNSGDLGVGSGNSGDLRYCLNLANANPGSTITLANNLGTISLASALPIITTSVTIQGGVGNAISGAGQHRIFFVNTASATDAVGIHNLNLTNGYAKGGDGGVSGGGGLGAGGALFVSTGAVALGNVSFNNNTAQGGKGGDGTSSNALTAGGGGGLGGNGGNGSWKAGGGGGGYGGDGGDAAPNVPGSNIGAGGGGGIRGNGGNGAGSVGGGGGGTGDGGTPAGGAGGGGAGGSLDGDTDGSNGSAGGGGGGGGGVNDATGVGSDGGNGGTYGGGGGSTINSSSYGFGGGVGGDFGGGAGNVGYTAKNGMGGFGGGGGGASSDHYFPTGSHVFGGDGGFGGGGGGAPWVPGSGGAYAGSGGFYYETFIGAPTNAPGAAGGGGGAALGGAVFVRSGAGASLDFTGTADTGTVIGGAGGASPASTQIATLVAPTSGQALGGAFFLPAGNSTFRSGSVTGDIAGVGGAALRKAGTGTLTLSGTNTYDGGTILEAGTLALGSSDAIGAIGTISFTGGTLQFSAANTNDYSLRFSSAANQSFLFDTNGQNIRLGAGLFSTGGSLTKTGTGTLTLAGANSFTGATTISGGTLKLEQVAIALQLEADQGVTTTGGKVTDWTDLSGQGNNAAAGAGDVTLSTLSNGKAALVFGSGSHLSDPLSASGGGYTILSVVEPTALSGDQTILGSSAHGNLQMRVSGANLQLLQQNEALLVSSSTTVTGGAPAMLSATVTNGAQSLFIGGTASGTGTASYTPGSGANFLIGARTGGSEAFNGKIAALLIYDTILSSAQISEVQDYLSGRFLGGVASSLPSFASLPSLTPVNITASGAALDVNGAIQTIGSLAGVAGSAVYLGGGALTVGTDGSDKTFAGAIADLGGSTSLAGGTLTKVGAGTWTLTGNNTYSGGTTVKGGVLAVNADAALGSGSLTLDGGQLRNTADLVSSRGVTLEAGGGTFHAAGGYLTLTSPVTGQGALTHVGGFLTLTGAQTYAGATVVQGGTLKIDNGSLASPSVALSVGASLLFAGSGSYTGNITGAGALAKEFSGTLTLTGNNTYTGGTTLSGGTLALGSAGALGTTGTIALNGGTLQFSANNTTDYSSRFGSAASQQYLIDTNGQTVTFASNLTSSDGALVKLGTGTLTLTGNNSLLSGGISVAGGILLMGSNTALGSGPVAINGGTLDLNGRTQTSSGLSGSGGAIIFGTLNSTQSENFTFSGAVNNSQVVLSGPGTLTLAGSTDNAAGTAVVNSGVLVLGKSSSASVHAVGTAGNGLTVNNGGTARLGGSGGDQIFSGASVALNTGGVFDLNGRSEGFNNLVGNGTVLNNAASTAATLTLGEGNGNSTFSGTLRDGAGTLALSKSGIGTLTLTGNNSLLSGGVTVNGGTLLMGSNTALGSGPTAVNGGTLDLNGRTHTSSGFSGSGGAIAFGTLNSTQSGNSTFSGAVNNSQVVLSGPGTLTLAGSTDNGDGTAVVNAGVLVLGKSSSASVHAVGTAGNGLTVNNGGTARLGGSGGDQIFSGASVALNTGGVFDLNGRSEGFNNLVGNGTVLNNAASTSATLTLGEGNGNATFSGTLQDGTGTVALSKTGTGTLTLTGNNTYTGSTTISGGVLALSLSGRLHASTALTVASGAVLDAINSPSFSVGSLAGAGNVILGSGVTLTTGSANNSTTFSGSVIGSGASLSKVGNGTLTLTGNNTHTGGTALSGGTLALGSSGALGTTGTIAFSGGTLQFSANNTTDYSGRFGTSGSQQYRIDTNGQTVTFASNLTSSGGTLVKLGNGTLTLTSNNTYTGGTTISGGTLQFGNGTATGTPGQGAIINNAILAFNPGGSLQVSNGISGTGFIQKDGTGTLTLTGNNSLLSGGVTVNGGTLLMGSNTALGSGPVAVNGGTLDLNGRTQTSSGLSGSGGAIIFGTLNSTQSGNSTFSGAVNNSQVVLSGTGTLTLAGSTDNAAGTVVVNAGVLVLGKSSSASVHAVGTAGNGLTVNNGGTARLGGSGGDQIFSGASVALNAGGVFDLNGRSEGFNRLVGGGTVLNSAAATTGTLTLGEDNGNATFTGVLQNGNGTVALKKAGSGTLTLSGNNSYSGGTTINAGTFIAAHNQAAGTGAVTVNGGVFLVESGISITNDVHLSGGSYHRTFAQGASLEDAVDATSGFLGGRPNTTARILEGTLDSASQLETSFSESSGALNDGIRQSDVYSLHGTGTNIFVLQLSITGLDSESYLAWLDADTGSATYNQWINAVEGNSGGTPTFFARGYNAATDFQLGNYGVDIAAGSVWAVLNHNSDFAIIPEPATCSLILGTGLMFLAAQRRRKFR